MSPTPHHYSDEHYRLIVEHSRDAMLVIDNGADIVFASRACEEVFGFAAGELIGTSGLDLLHPDDVENAIGRLAGSFDHAFEMQPPMRVRFRTSSGEFRWVETRSQYERPDARLGGVVLNVRDVHDQVLAEHELIEAKERLAYLASHDPLTGLANRARCIEHLEGLCTELIDDVASPFVLFVDVDHFKAVNDTFGHAGGDAVLVAIAHRMQSAVRGSDLVARLGGDEFVIVCHGGTAEVMRRVLDRVAKAMDEPVAFESGLIAVTVSTGFTHIEAGQAASDVLALADHAMYEAKSRGRNQWAGPVASGA